jgi:hypothetical protein
MLLSRGDEVIIKNEITIQDLIEDGGDIQYFFFMLQKIVTFFFNFIFVFSVIVGFYQVTSQIILTLLLLIVACPILFLLLYLEFPKNEYKQYTLRLILKTIPFALLNYKTYNIVSNYKDKILKKKKYSEILQCFTSHIDCLNKFEVLIYLLNNYHKLSISEKNKIAKNFYISDYLQHHNDFVIEQLNTKSLLKNEKNIKKKILADVIHANLNNF